jgi:hypothetical protein
VSIGPHYEGLHPWDDPNRVPAEWRCSLQDPHPNIDPRDFRTLQDYQEALAARHLADREALDSGTRRVVRHIRDNDLDWDDLKLYALLAVVFIFALCMGIGWVGNTIYEAFAGPSDSSSSASEPYRSGTQGSQRSLARPTDDASPEPQGPIEREGSGALDPESTVLAYYDAVNRRDYDEAWSLGGMNLSASRSNFISGYRSTVHDEITITGVTGSTVGVIVVARKTGGETETYVGHYEVSDGVIASGSLRKR